MAATASMTPFSSPTMTMTQTPEACGTACSNGVARIGQGSPNPWATVQIDSTTDAHDTIAYVGCFLTCYSMMDSQGRTPDELNKLFDDEGDFGSTGGLDNYVNAANTIHLNCSSQAITDPDAENVIAENICTANTYVVVGLNPSHYVLVTGQQYDPVLQKCRFTIDDPAHANHTFLDQYTDTTEARTIQNVEVYTRQSPTPVSGH